jgi:tRNA A37 threonylcarbamoyladenosine modification protein TsaB
LAENFKNILVFDASSSNIFFGGECSGKTVFMAENFEKSKLSRYLPEEFGQIAGNLDFTELPRVIIGNGPGAFTGIKTGTAFFLAYIYSIGIKTVETVSSFSFISALSGECTAEIRIVLIPFNKGEYFAAVLDKNNKILRGDVFIKPPYDNISSFFAGFSGRKAEIAAPIECGSEIIPELEKIFSVVSVRFNGFSFDRGRFDAIPDTKKIDITAEPYIVNHVIMPANLDSNGNFYVEVELQEAKMAQDSFSREEILEKLKQLKEEHSKLNEKSGEISSKKVFTPADEAELNLVRKKKLRAKDMIAYFENLLKTKE